MARGRFSKRPTPELECWDCGDLIAACQCGEAINCMSIGEVAGGGRHPLVDHHIHHYSVPSVQFVSAERGQEIEEQQRQELQAVRERVQKMRFDYGWAAR